MHTTWSPFALLNILTLATLLHAPSLSKEQASLPLPHSQKSKHRFHSLVPQVEYIVVRVDYMISDEPPPSSLSLSTVSKSSTSLPLLIASVDNGESSSDNKQPNTSAALDSSQIEAIETASKKSIDTFGQRTSIYRGVTRWTGRYEAHLWDNSCRRDRQTRKGRQGGYDKEEKAARAYDLAALKYRGTTTTTNFPRIYSIHVISPHSAYNYKYSRGIFSEQKFPFKFVAQSFGDKWKLNDISTSFIQERLNVLMSRNQNLWNEVTFPLVKPGQTRKPDSENDCGFQVMEEILMIE
ncbi:hypothetical protein JHK82_016378 [Glycine max]|nr:hypothetical protein JHK82_016378 [Glycine max]